MAGRKEPAAPVVRAAEWASQSARIEGDLLNARQVGPLQKQEGLNSIWKRSRTVAGVEARCRKPSSPRSSVFRITRVPRGRVTVSSPSLKLLDRIFCLAVPPIDY
jgi:hypothetical protein